MTRSQWLRQVLSEFVGGAQPVAVVTSGVRSKSDFAALLWGGADPVLPESAVSGRVARVCDEAVARRTFQPPPLPVSVIDLLESRLCHPACLLARGTESAGCSCECRGRYHAALIGAEVPA